MFRLYHLSMKKYLYLCIMLWILFISTISVVPVQASDDWHFNENPVKVLEKVKKNANKSKTEQIQKTELDNTTSRWCKDIAADPRYTITKTLCYVKNNVWSYLQYVMFIWLTAATIIIIWNGFKLVTSPNREKEMEAFKKNIVYIIIWVTLLLGFYYFLDIYVWIVNLFSD